MFHIKNEIKFDKEKIFHVVDSIMDLNLIIASYYTLIKLISLNSDSELPFDYRFDIKLAIIRINSVSITDSVNIIF